MLSRLAVVATALVASGCLTSAPTQPLASLPDLAGTRAGPRDFGEPALVGGGTIEASLEVGRDGAMLVCSVFSKLVWASEDGGRSWRAHEPIPGYDNGDCDVAIGDDGAWYVVFSTRGNLTLAVSIDRGATWQEHWVWPLPTTMCGPWTPDTGNVPCLSHRPWLRVLGQDVYLTYYSIFPGAVFFQKSNDAGATWTRPFPIAVADGPDRLAAGSGEMDVTPDGRTIRVPIVRYPALYQGQIGLGAGVGVDSRQLAFDLAESRDGGSTWGLQRMAGPVQARKALSNVARAGGGELFYPIALVNESKVDLTLVVSRDDGVTWSEPFVLASGLAYPAGFPTVSLDAAPDGSVVAAWYHWVEAEGASGWQIQVAKLLATAADPVQWIANASQPAGEKAHLEFLGLDHDPEGRIHIAYPVPEDPCGETERRDCIYHLAQVEAPSHLSE